jgi:hypothetical protein
MPGDPLANVTFKTYGYISQYQALLLVSDLKLGHYMKVISPSLFLNSVFSEKDSSSCNVYHSTD